jgi:hypothetical protein
VVSSERATSNPGDARDIDNTPSRRGKVRETRFDNTPDACLANINYCVHILPELLILGIQFVPRVDGSDSGTANDAVDLSEFRDALGHSSFDRVVVRHIADHTEHLVCRMSSGGNFRNGFGDTVLYEVKDADFCSIVDEDVGYRATDSACSSRD